MERIVEIIRTVFYKSFDGIKFKTEKECKEWETHIKLKDLHKKLLLCHFHSRCKVVPYEINGTTLKDINPAPFFTYLHREELNNKNVYIVGYRICYYDNTDYDVLGYLKQSAPPIPYYQPLHGVTYRLRGGKVILLRCFKTHKEKPYLCTIPSKWIDLPIEELKKEVEVYLLKRKVYIRQEVLEPKYIKKEL